MQGQTRITMFTHSDLDGIGCAVLANHVFEKRESRIGRRIGNIGSVVFVDYSNIDQNVEKYLKKVALEDEHKPRLLVITDICPRKEIIDQITAEVKPGVLEAVVIDHHQTTAWLGGYDYPWLVHDQSACATKLFSHWLEDNLNIAWVPGDVCRFVDQVDAYDRWLLAHPLRASAEKLNRLLWFLGFDRFIEVFSQDLLASEHARFKYIDECLLDKECREIANVLRHQLNDENTYTDKEGRRFLLAFVEKYTSQIGNAVLEENANIDYVVMVGAHKGYVSLRARDNGVDVAKIAERLGGGGHRPAAAFQFPTVDTLQACISKLF